jgi:hypothetical protein
VAASTWGLVALTSALWGQDGFEGGLWVELAAHVVLVLAGCLAGRALTRAAEVRLVRRAPQGDLPWLVALLGVIGAVALCFQTLIMVQSSNGLNMFGEVVIERWRVAPSIWATFLALVVPWCAALAAPRRFGVALLGGWIGGGAAFFVYYFSVLARLEFGSIPVSIFGLTLLVLLVVTVLFARTARSSPVERTA